MLSSHLPWTPCNKFVYDIPGGFWGIIGATAYMYVFTLSTSIVRFLVRALGAGRGKICTEAAQSQRLYV